MSNQKEKRGFSNFGFSTILLSFVMICVVTFSALSLISANSDYKLSQKTADKTTGYYEAAEKAYDTLLRIEQLLQKIRTNSTGRSDYFAAVAEAAGDYGFLTPQSDHYLLSYEIPISENHFLSVKLLLYYPENEGDYYYDVFEWKSVYIQTIPEEETLNLIQ